MTTKVAIVTGGAGGIGKAIAGVLLKQGYKVAILDIDEELGKQTADGFSSQFGSGSCDFFNCDVTETEQLKGCYGQILESMGYVAVLVNNAGYFDESNFKKMIDVNLIAVIDLTYITVKHMRKDNGGNGGAIVNISSGVGLGSFPGKTAYTASKWGVIGFTKSMAASVALAEQDWGISIMTLCPTATRTEHFGNRPPSISPAIPQAENLNRFGNTVKNVETSSLDELAEAFETLLRDNKNGAVMRCHKPKGSAAQTTYVEQKWTEI